MATAELNKPNSNLGYQQSLDYIVPYASRMNKFTGTVVGFPPNQHTINRKEAKLPNTSTNDNANQRLTGGRDNPAQTTRKSMSKQVNILDQGVHYPTNNNIANSTPTAEVRADQKMFNYDWLIAAAVAAAALTGIAV